MTCGDLKSLALSKELEISELRRSFRSTRRSPTDSVVWGDGAHTMATTSFKPIAMAAAGTNRRSSFDGFSVDDDASEGASRGGKRRDSRRLR